MKFLKTVIFIELFFCHQGYAVISEGDIESLQRSMQIIDRQFDTEKPEENAVLILGTKGSGKTALSKYLFGTRLNARQTRSQKDPWHIYEGEPSLEQDIKPGSVSATTNPVHRGIYWDCPGFDDTRGPLQDILNMYHVYKLRQKVRNTKIILTVSQADCVANRSAPFLEILSQVGEMFSDNLLGLSQSLCFVFTKSVAYTSEELRKDFLSMLKEQESLMRRSAVTDHQQQILKMITELPNDRIAFFENPTREGILPHKNRELILLALEHTTYTQNLHPRFSVSLPSIAALEGLYGVLMGKLSEFLKNSRKGVAKFLDIEFRKHTASAGIRTAKELRASFAESLEECKKLSYTVEGFYEDAAIALKIFKRVGVQSAPYEQLLSCCQFVEKIGTFRGECKRNTGIWYDITKVSEYLKRCSHLEAVFHKNTLTVKGFIVGTEDLTQFFDRYPQISAIDVYGFSGFFIEEDLRMPSVNLSILSPFWCAIGKDRVIDLTGNDGELYGEPAREMEDGQSGNPGHPGGHFYGAGYAFDNVDKNLTIITKGGRGGEGQKGGAGRLGVDGNKEDVENKKKDKCHVSPYQSKWETLRWAGNILMTFGNKRLAQVYQSGTLEEKGGYGGYGGQGGNPGIVTFTGSAKMSIENDPGKSGKEGDTPEVRPAKVFRGIWVQEEFLGLHFQLFNQIIEKFGLASRGYSIEFIGWRDIWKFWNIPRKIWNNAGHILKVTGHNIRYYGVGTAYCVAAYSAESQKCAYLGWIPFISSVYGHTPLSSGWLMKPYEIPVSLRDLSLKTDNRSKGKAPSVTALPDYKTKRENYDKFLRELSQKYFDELADDFVKIFKKPFNEM